MLHMLDRAAEDRLLIINADDLGITQGTNEAVSELFASRAIASASIMMPCPGAREAAQLCLQDANSHIGIHLTLSSEQTHPYRPVYQKGSLSSLVTTDGFFHSDLSYIGQHGDPEEIRCELEAQIQLALTFGIDPTHLDSHGGTIMGLAGGRDYLEIVFDLCEKYRLPFNLPTRIVEQSFITPGLKMMFQARIESARQRGILLIDDLISLPYCMDESVGYEQAKDQLMKMLWNLKAGVTQWTVHPSWHTLELVTLTSCAREREIEYRLLLDEEISSLLKSEGIHLVSWKDIRDAQKRAARHKRQAALE